MTRVSQLRVYGRSANDRAVNDARYVAYSDDTGVRWSLRIAVMMDGVQSPAVVQWSVQ